MNNAAQKYVSMIMAGLALTAFLTLATAYQMSKPAFLEVNFFDVGQGDSIFIQTPERHQIIMDGGPNSLVLEKLSKEMPFWDRTIDLMVLTHPEKDHISGLLDVLERYDVENVLWTGVARNSAEFREWQRLLEKEGANIVFARSGQKILFPGRDREEIAMEILNPTVSMEGKEVRDSNETSVVCRLSFGSSSFLFTGDISKSTEKRIVEKNTNIQSDVLKVAHHGSKYSSDEGFIGKVFPEIAVIQSGKGNSYGHPSPEILAVLEKYGISILRTDINKDIKIICDSQFLKPSQEASKEGSI